MDLLSIILATLFLIWLGGAIVMYDVIRDRLEDDYGWDMLWGVLLWPIVLIANEAVSDDR